MEGKKKLGLPSVVATGVGVIVATSCLLFTWAGSRHYWEHHLFFQWCWLVC